VSVSSIAVVGLGYIGLPTAAMFASRKKRVIGIDVDPRVVETINRGSVHIAEPDLDMLVNAAVSQGYLTATSQPVAADAFIIAVPTPFSDDHAPDLACIASACETIAPVLRPGNLVILESTSPVGTTEQVGSWLARHRPDLTFPADHGDGADIRLAYCPERVLPGRILHELSQNDRIVGGMSARCAAEAITLYQQIVVGNCIATGARTAEMCKLAENTFRDVNIALANEFSLLCDRFGVDVWELIDLANKHPRVNILQPGVGVGGHCIAVDPWFLATAAPETARLIRTAREVNNGKPLWVCERIETELYRRNLRRVICLGAAFKPDVDDLRESPAINVIQRLLDCGWSVGVVEPNVEMLPPSLAARCELLSLDAALAAADSVLAVLVAHGPFKIERGALLSAGAVDFCGILAGGMRRH